MAYRPIEDHGVVGDLNTVALIGLDGSVDFMCFPFFDSPSIFAALLDDRNGGRFEIRPAFEARRNRQFYLPDSNILITRFLADDGVAELSDFMPVAASSGHGHTLVRRLKTVRGDLTYRMRCAPRFDYGRATHTVERVEGGVVFRSQGADRTAVRLRSSCPVDIQDGAAVAEIHLRAGEHASFILEPVLDGPAPSTAGDYVARTFKETTNYWRRFVARSTYTGRWREEVSRSALVLKLLTSQRHGSLVAAPTFGLPEEIGGIRNWDYRYTWIRDASFTLYAFMRLGLHEETHAFFRWIEEICKTEVESGPLQIMYGLDGRRDLVEESLPHLEGYQGSRPVRVGNGAYNQLQLDIYGELMDTVYLYDKYAEPVHYDLWVHLVRLVDWVCDNWRRPDAGIWEVRGGDREFLYSKLMCWVAVDRGLRIARHRSWPAPLERWMACRDMIHHDIFTRYWSLERQAFTMAPGTHAMDAATLMMPLVKFIGPRDPRWLSTMRAIEEDLVEDSFVFRYRLDGEAPIDGLAGHEGTFSICTFWYVECLSRAGDLDQARLYFEKTLGHANHVGLFSEELGPCGEQLGNFPQAFTHLALISAAFDLDRRLGNGPRK